MSDEEITEETAEDAPAAEEVVADESPIQVSALSSSVSGTPQR